jgi:hypothetical protein
MRKYRRGRKLKEICSLTQLFFLKATVKVEQTILRNKTDTIKMDVELKAKLEAIRQRTPRYLFRLWSNSEEETPNGGYLDLNTTTAVTPLAFSRGKGHKSAYHMTKEEFTTMTKAHLDTRQDIETEFSSWSASLTFILNKCPGVGTGGVKLASRGHENLHVSVIDTKMLWATNQVFYAPLLGFLSPGDFGYPHEYLLHGVVQGSWYKATPYSVLQSSPGFGFSSSWYFHADAVECEPLTKEAVETARAAAELFGEKWTLPMMLAILSCQRREKDLWRYGVKEDDLNKVLDGIQGLRVPARWRKDKTITGHIISSKNYSDTRQLTRLMRALIGRRKPRDHPRCDDEVSGDEESEYEDAVVESTLEIEPDEPDELPVESEATKEDENTGSGAQEEAKQAEVAVGVLSKRSRRKGKVPEGTDRKETDSVATAAARAIWRRKYSTGRLTKLKS